ncbi:MAG: nucleotidyltransferase domain-containing protein [Archaeoglobales archaeon]|jgi:predicted nucleotidyltransferase|nr:nucleotidyltransferase domain-containing protein [Archaeoglobales archaeon]TDA25268.1 MAG: nucleotidyltransferase domain-containing protein [Archaeoglobi archaeon]
MMKYYEMLKKNGDFFAKAFDIARDVKKRARELFRECEVFIVGSFARGDHKLSSDLDILIVSDSIPERLRFEEYCEIVKKIAEDPRINIHLLSRSKFHEYESLYRERIEV